MGSASFGCNLNALISRIFRRTELFGNLVSTMVFQIVAAADAAGVEEGEGFRGVSEGGVLRRPDFAPGFSDLGLVELAPPIATENSFAMSGD
jgi:hypothetical protein